MCCPSRAAEGVTNRSIRASCLHPNKATMPRHTPHLPFPLLIAFCSAPAPPSRSAWSPLPLCLAALTSGLLPLLRSGSSFPERLVAFAAVASVFNAGSFAGLYWFKKVGLIGQCQRSLFVCPRSPPKNASRFAGGVATHSARGGGLNMRRALLPCLQRGLLPGLGRATDLISVSWAACCPVFTMLLSSAVAVLWHFQACTICSVAASSCAGRGGTDPVGCALSYSCRCCSSRRAAALSALQRDEGINVEAAGVMYS